MPHDVSVADIQDRRAGAGPEQFSQPLAAADRGRANQVVLRACTVLMAQVDSLRAGNLYFNVHSAANPGGEIRGQIGSRGGR